MQPLRDEVIQLTDALLPRRESLKSLKKGKADSDAIAATEEAIYAKEKAIRELHIKISDIDAAAFDLKAVNPNVKAQYENRTVQEIIERCWISASLSNWETMSGNNGSDENSRCP